MFYFQSIPSRTIAFIVQNKGIVKHEPIDHTPQAHGVLKAAAVVQKAH
jgi:hypothetical protein